MGPKLWHDQWLSIKAVQDFIAGGVAGVVSRTAVAPLERVKILLQVQLLSSQGAPVKYTTILGSLRHIVEKEGPRGLMKGNAANCVRVFPSSAIQFSSYGALKSYLYGDRSLTATDRLVAGALAGAVAQTLTYPLDLVRARLSVDMAGRYRSGILGTLVEVVREGGPRALYRGLGPSLAGIMPYVGIDFAVYDTLRPLLPKRSGSDEPAVAGKLAAGAVAGACGQTVAYPLDTVRRILQVTLTLTQSLTQTLTRTQTRTQLAGHLAAHPSGAGREGEAGRGAVHGRGRLPRPGLEEGRRGRALPRPPRELPQGRPLRRHQLRRLRGHAGETSPIQLAVCFFVYLSGTKAAPLIFIAAYFRQLVV